MPTMKTASTTKMILVLIERRKMGGEIMMASGPRRVVGCPVWLIATNCYAGILTRRNPLSFQLRVERTDNGDAHFIRAALSFGIYLHTGLAGWRAEHFRLVWES